MEVSLNCTKFQENELREKNLDLCITCIPMDLDNLLAIRDTVYAGFPAQIVVYKNTQKHGFRNTGHRLLVYGDMKFEQLLFCRG